MKEMQNQFSTFYINDKLYGINVMRVQEITKSLPMTKVPLSPNYVYGLINLRGQISTAISLRELFLIKTPEPEECMNVVCKIQDVLVSFIVDRIGDVIELDEKDFQESPETIPSNVRMFIKGIYQTPDKLLSVINVDRIAEFFNKVA